MNRPVGVEVVPPRGVRVGVVRQRGRMGVAALMVGVLVLGVGGWALASAETGVEVLGVLPPPPVTDAHNVDPVRNGEIIGVDGSRRELYYAYVHPEEGRYHVGIYDLSSRLPEFVRSVALPRGLVLKVSPRYAAFDPVGYRVVLMMEGYPEGTQFVVVSLRDGATELWAMQELVPGFHPEGISYSAADDRLYVVGEMVARSLGENWNSARPQSVTVVVALEADGGLAWVVPLLECQQPLNTYALGALVARGSFSAHLYVPCAQAAAAPRVSGVARIGLGEDPASASQEDAAGFEVDFFPVSGQYWDANRGILGLASFDRGSDRLFMQSLFLNAPGAWVFDGRVPGWTGFIALPRPMLAAGVSEGTGHYYAADSSGPLLVADGRDSPAPQGSLHPFSVQLSPTIVGDPGSRRFLIKTYLDRVPGLGFEKLNPGWLVLEDHTVSAPRAAREDYDAQTADVPEDEGSFSTFAGGVRGFGSRLHWVGGYQGASRGIAFRVSAAGVSLHPATRSVMAARVGSLDVREAGAAASAQAVAADGESADEWTTRQETLRHYCELSLEEDPENPQLCVPSRRIFEAVADEVGWPWDPVVCLDGTGEAVEDETPKPGEASLANKDSRAYVSCSRGDEQAAAAAAMRGVVADADTISVSVGSSSFDAQARRAKDPAGGRRARSTALAVTRDIHITTPAGELIVGEVRASAQVQAGGRPDTAEVVWQRWVSDVVFHPPGGEAHELGGCSDESCDELLARVNRRLGEFLRLEMPEAETRATPKGAFGGIRRSDGVYYDGLVASDDPARSVPALQATIYTDGAQKSRLIAQFAAIEATSIYTISAAARSHNIELPALPDPQPGLDDVVIDYSPSDESVRIGDQAFPARPRSIPETIRGTLAFLVRSPLEAFQLASILSLLVAAAAGVSRRLNTKHIYNTTHE